MTTAPSRSQPVHPAQPACSAQPHRGSDPTTAIPVQRAGSLVPPPAPKGPKAFRRWPFAVGSPVVGLVIGASVHGGSTTPTRTSSAARRPPLPGRSRRSPTEVGADIAVGKYKTPRPGSTDMMDFCGKEVGDGCGSLTGISQNDNPTEPVS